MTRKLALIAALIALVALGAGIAVGAGGGEAGEQGDLTGSAAQKAADAALAATGRGTVLEVERGDDGSSAYEVEIRKPNGDVVEVLLDDSYTVLETVAGDD